MKSLFLFLLLLPALFARSQSRSDPDQRAVRDLIDRQLNAWNRGRIEQFMEGYWQSDSLMFIGKTGVTYGYQQTLDHYKKSYPDTAAMGRLFFDILQTRRLGPDYYWVLGKWFLKRNIGDLGGHFTLLLRKLKGKWVIVADHTS